MATLGDDYGIPRCEHVIKTYWTVALRVILYTFVVLMLNANARAAFITMEVVDIQAPADPTDTALFAMIDMFCGVVFIKAASATVIG
mmetsp:Transcript_5675/g.8768  ORF Transcript_5675/g.8768 Transcript_5675/m.8768 type:complete len:87 (-) Transcript_5675:552-812(-)